VGRNSSDRFSFIVVFASFKLLGTKKSQCALKSNRCWLHFHDDHLVLHREEMPKAILLTHSASFIAPNIPPSMDQRLHSRPIITLHRSRQIRHHYVRILSLHFDRHSNTSLVGIQVQSNHLGSTVFDWHILHSLGAKRMCRRNSQCSISYGQSVQYAYTCFACKLRTVVDYF